MTSRAATTQRLQQIALEMFAARGYDDVTVAEIARAAGVSHMTFFRHFATKEAAVVEDVFDPLIAHAIAAQPATLAPLPRAVRGMAAALADPQAGAHMRSAAFRTRIRLIADTPSLRSAVVRSGRATEDAMVAVLAAGRTSAFSARAAAAAVMGAATAVLLDWAGAEDASVDPAAVLAEALLSLVDEAS